MNDFNEQELLRLKKRTAIPLTVSLICFAAIFGIGFIFHYDLGPLYVVLFGMLFVSFLITIKASKKYNAYYKEHIVKNMTLDDCDFLDDITFEPDMGISASEIRELDVMSWDRFSSNDLITATYKGVYFRQSDVTMEDETTDSDGHTQTHTIFKGRWLIFDFNKDFNWNLKVRSKGFNASNGVITLFGNKRKSEKILMESEEFNKMFKVIAEDPHEAFYILTPNMMEKLMELKSTLNVPIMLVFNGGVLHIAVHNNKDAFEGKIFGKIDIEEEKKRVFEDIKLITDFVDVLALERDIYKH